MRLDGATLIAQVDVPDRAIAFTFDDGPDPLYTPQILDIFRETGGRATFFMIGQMMERHPEIVRAVADAGHEIGNHTWSHPKLTEIGAEARQRELADTDRLIREMAGRAPASFRPPYFDMDGDVAALCDRFGYRMFGAVNTDARDWDMPGVEHIVASTRASIASGSVLLFHDGFGDRSQTVAAVRILTAELAAQGFRFVTVSELLQLQEKKETE